MIARTVVGFTLEDLGLQAVVPGMLARFHHRAVLLSGQLALAGNITCISSFVVLVIYLVVCYNDTSVCFLGYEWDVDNAS